VAVAPAGVFQQSPNSVRISFDEAVDVSAFSKAVYALADSQGTPIAITSVDQVSTTTAQINFSTHLDNGDFTLNILPGITDIAGNALTGTSSFDFNVSAATRVISLSPTDGTKLANLDRHVVVEFDRAIDPATLDQNSFQVLVNMQPLTGRISVSNDGKFASFTLAEGTLFPPSSNVRIMLDGETILDANGAKVDVDNDGIVGGVLTSDFSTVSVTPIPGTGIFGYIYDSNNRGPNGEDIPLVGVDIDVIGLPGVTATTDANGYFELNNLPYPDAYLHFDASNVPAANQFQYGTIVKPISPVRTRQLG